METKKPYTSRTIIGGVLAILAGGIGLLGYTVSAEDIATLEMLIASATSVVGGILSVYGRIKATKRIS